MASSMSVDASGADPLYQFLDQNSAVPEATPAQNQRLKQKL